MEINLHLAPEAAAFYSRIAAANGMPLCRVLEDALFLLAGELSLEALQVAQSGQQQAP